MVVACRIASVAGIFVIIALVSTPLLHWRRRHCCAIIFANRRHRDCRHPCRCQTQLSIAVATCHRHSRIKTPSHHRLSVVHCCRRMLPRCHCHRTSPPPPPPPPLPAAATAGHYHHHHHRHLRCRTPCCPLPKKEATAAPTPAYHRQHQCEIVYKS